MKKEITDISTGLLLLLFSIAGYVLTQDFAPAQSTVKYGPDFFPKLVFSLLALTSIILLVSGLRKLKQSEGMIHVQKNIVLMILLFIIVLIGYITLFFVAGFIISTIIFLVIGQWLFGIRKIKLVLPVSVLVPIALYFVFTQLFQIPLP